MDIFEFCSQVSAIKLNGGKCQLQGEGLLSSTPRMLTVYLNYEKWLVNQELKYLHECRVKPIRNLVVSVPCRYHSAGKHERCPLYPLYINISNDSEIIRSMWK